MRKFFQTEKISRSGLLFFAILFFVNLAIIFSYYQTKPEFNIVIGSSEDYLYIDGFYAIEKSELGEYRWSKDSSFAQLPLVGSPYDISVTAASYRPGNGALPQFALNWNSPSQTQTYQSTGAPAEYLLKGNAGPVFQFQQGILSINTGDTFRPPNDDRDLGLLVQQVSIKAHPNSFGFVLPPFWTWFSISGGLLVLQAYIFIVGTRLFLVRRRFLGPSLLLPSIGLGLLVVFAPNVILQTGFSLGVGLLALGTAGFLLLRFEKAGSVWIGLMLALLTLGVFYKLFSFLAPQILAIGLVPLLLYYNPRFRLTRYNLLLLAVAAIFACANLLQQRAIHTHDGEFFHYYWLNEFDQLIKAGNFYPRWAPDFSFGHGNAIFNFYAPLSRYLAEIFVLLKLPPAFAIQAYLTLITFAAGVSSYFLARHLTGGLGALVAAVAYIYHPYRLAEIYQRGDMAEVLNFVFIPLILLAAFKILEAGPGWDSLLPAIGGGLALALAIVSHQLSAFFFGVLALGPLLLLNLFFLFYRAWSGEGGSLNSALKKLAVKIGWLALIPVLGLGLAAFYALPVIIESNFIRLKNSAGFTPELSVIDFGTDNWKELVPVLQVSSGNLNSINNLAWIGVTQLLLALVATIIALLPVAGFSRRQRQRVVAFSLVGAFLLVMQLPFTFSFWQNTPVMSLIQFSWRLMMPVALMAALLIGHLAESLPVIGGKLLGNWQRRSFASGVGEKFIRTGSRIFGIILLCLVLGYSGAGRIEVSFQTTLANGELAQKHLRDQIDHGDRFYLPIWANNVEAIAKNPTNYAAAYIVTGNVRQTDPVVFNQLSSTRYRVETDVKVAGALVLPVFYFPGWTLTSDNRTIPVTYSTPDGFIMAELPAGKHILELRLETTLVQNLGTLLSLLTLLVMLGLAIFSLKKKSATKHPRLITVLPLLIFSRKNKRGLAYN